MLCALCKLCLVLKRRQFASKMSSTRVGLCLADYGFWGRSFHPSSCVLVYVWMVCPLKQKVLLVAAAVNHRPTQRRYRRDEQASFTAHHSTTGQIFAIRQFVGTKKKKNEFKQSAFIAFALTSKLPPALHYGKVFNLLVSLRKSEISPAHFIPTPSHPYASLVYRTSSQSNLA